MDLQDRYLPHGDLDDDADLSEVRNVLIDALRKGLRRASRHPSNHSSVYIGGGGHLLLNWKLADMLPQLNLEQIDVDITTFGLARVHSESKVSFLQTCVGTATLILAQHLRTPSNSTARSLKTARWVIHEAIKLAIEKKLDDDGCDVMYGRAGLLYSLLYLRGRATQAAAQDPNNENAAVESIENLASDKHVRLLVNDIVARGRCGAEDYARETVREDKQPVPWLMWKFRGERQLGSGYGVAGILQMLLCVPESILAPHWDVIVITIEWLISIQEPSGNWLEDASCKFLYIGAENDLVQWCHGASGILMLLSTLLQRSNQFTNLRIPPSISSSARTALARGGLLVYTRGMVRKGVGLCHGVPSSIYGLLAAASVFDPPDEVGPWRRRAVQLALLTCDYEDMTKREELYRTNLPYSLYEGVAGMCAAWADVISGLDGKGWGNGMLGYNDLTW